MTQPSPTMSDTTYTVHMLSVNNISRKVFNQLVRMTAFDRDIERVQEPGALIGMWQGNILMIL